MASSTLREGGTAGKGETKSFSAYYLTGIGVKIIKDTLKPACSEQR